MARLRTGVAEPVQQRPAAVVEPGERQVHLELGARGLHDPTSRCMAGAVVQQGGLADPDVALQNQDLAVTGPRLGHRAVQGFSLGLTPTQPRSGARR